MIEMKQGAAAYQAAVQVPAQALEHLRSQQ